MLEFEWDEGKNRVNRAKHGWDFADAIRVFLDPLFDGTEYRSLDYGERRYKVTGYAGYNFGDRHLHRTGWHRSDDIRAQAIASGAKRL